MISERRLAGRYNARSPSTGGLFFGGTGGTRLWPLNAILRQLRYGAGHRMTLHDTFFSANPYFLSFPVFWPDAGKVAFSLVFYL